MRHMAANFYERFKNKDLMNLFNRLCTQNQQRKFDALWGIIDDMSACYRHKLTGLIYGPKARWA